MACMREFWVYMHLLDIQYVRWLLDNKYTTGADGLPGNDDYGDYCRPYYNSIILLFNMQCCDFIGTMSAWFVWGTLGLYPLTGTDKYFLGSPAIDNATLHFENGN